MFRYPGGKSKLKKKISSIIKLYYRNNNCCYVEPFVGGGSIWRELINNVESVAINDYDIGIAAFWHSLINSPDELCNFVNDFNPTIEDFYNFKNIFLDDSLRKYILKDHKYSLVEVGFMKMALHQISFSGLGTRSGGPLGGAFQKSKYKIGCRWNSKNIENRIWKLHNDLRRINIIGKTCFYDDCFIFMKNMLDKFKHSFLYLDPPYYQKGPELYQFYFNDDQHKKMAELLQEVNCPWLLSYDCCEEIREMYKWAVILEIDVKCTINTKNRSVSKREFLIIDKKYKYLLE
jgi:DNA adenine methylase